nr:MAG TPA: hypothetical protein [Caudoviricetes sp.]
MTTSSPTRSTPASCACTLRARRGRTKTRW